MALLAVSQPEGVRVMADMNLLRRVFALADDDDVVGANLQVAEFHVCSSETWDVAYGRAFIVARDDVLSEMGGDFQGKRTQACALRRACFTD